MIRLFPQMPLQFLQIAAGKGLLIRTVSAPLFNRLSFRLNMFTLPNLL